MDVTEPAQPTVRAAGGIVWRDRGSDAGSNVEVLLIHRPRYDDWSLPKGKLDAGEDEPEGALREVEEETGLVCALGRLVGRVEYHDRHDRPKTVDYFEMRPLEGEFVPSAEVDRIRWLTLVEAGPMLTYAHDRELLERFDGPGVPLYLIRHADAGARSGWSRPDDLRPLTPRGGEQAARIAAVLRYQTLERLISSPAVRCVQTLEPLADKFGLPIERAADLAEGAPIDEALAFILKEASRPAAFCSHGDVVEGTVRRLLGGNLPAEGGSAFAKGSTWVIRIREGASAALRYVPPP